MVETGSDATASPVVLADTPDFQIGHLQVLPRRLHVGPDGEGGQILEPRVMQVLVALARANEGVVSRDELTNSCWGGRIVEDNSVNRCIHALRQVAKRIEPTPFEIETIPRIGYRLVRSTLEQHGSSPRANIQSLQRPAPIAARVGQFGLLHRRIFAGSVAVAAIIAVALFWLSASGSKPPVPIVQVSAADSSGPSQAIARNLLVKLGHVQSTRPGLMTLVDGRKGERTPDLILEIEATNVDQQANASLALRDGKRAGLLWSKDFQQTHTNQADLRQQVAFTAARVLGCALEGMNTQGRELNSETQKVYLNACAQLSEIGPDGPEQVIPALLRVVDDAPAFKPGWAKLLMVEAETARSDTGKADADARKLLRKHIDTARRLDSTMPEALLAEISLLPRDKFQQAQEIADRAKQLDPNNAAVLNVRSSLLLGVGRMNEGIDEAQRAAKLDPLSPELQGYYILALAYGGRIEHARAELRRAERLWQGTDALRGVQYAFHLRFGDPRQALQLGRSIPDGLRLYLEARLNPSPENVSQMVAYGNSRPGIAAQRGLGAGYLSFIIPAYGEFGRHDDLFRGAMGWPRRVDLSSESYMLFRPALKRFRHEPRFMQVAKRAGLVDYWRRSGKWPDFCFEPDLPYDCKKEAAKVA